jgi:hypothetical protein
VPLSETDGTWVASWLGSATTQFFIQMVDNAGNVIVVDKNGLYFQPGDGVMWQFVYLPLVTRGY